MSLFIPSPKRIELIHSKSSSITLGPVIQTLKLVFPNAFIQEPGSKEKADLIFILGDSQKLAPKNADPKHSLILQCGHKKLPFIKKRQFIASPKSKNITETLNEWLLSKPIQRNSLCILTLSNNTTVHTSLEIQSLTVKHIIKNLLQRKTIGIDHGSFLSLPPLNKLLLSMLIQLIPSRLFFIYSDYDIVLALEKLKNNHD